MLGYWKQPELTRQTIVDGWLRTGDAGYMDEDGFVYLVDRVKDMIISGGENVFSAEVENALAGHPAIAECAVIGVPDQRWGERVHAIVRLREGTSVTEDDVIAHCKTLIAGYKCPRSVEFRQEPLPLSAAGKILKSELRKSYWQDGARHIN
jgi:long-chain acyl-CoA synthetase